MSMKNPWLSLASYQTSDSYRFKGRSNETIKFYDIIRKGAMSVLYANSGTGKTSFINAAIVPKLQAEEKYLPIRILFPDDKDIKSRTKWFFEFIKDLKAVDPENDKQILAERYEWKLIDENHEWKLEKAEEEILSASLWWLLHNYELRIKGTKERVLPLFIFDQFEEVFTKPIGEGADNTNDLTSLFKLFSEISSRAYPSDVLSVLRCIESRTDEYIEVDTKNNFKIIFSLRKEYLSDFDYWANDRFSITELRQNRMFLLPMTREQAIQVITEQPIDENNPDEFCERLDNIKENILNIIDEKHKNVVEPIMLSLICSNMFELSENNGGRSLAPCDIEKNDINTIVGKFYEEAVSKVITDLQDRDKFEEEITDKQGHRERKKAISILDGKFDKSYKKALADAHIIRIEKYDDEDYVELIHDKLAVVISNLRIKRKEVELENKRKKVEADMLKKLEKQTCLTEIEERKRIKAEEEKCQKQRELEEQKYLTEVEENRRKAVEHSKGNAVIVLSLIVNYAFALTGVLAYYMYYLSHGGETDLFMIGAFVLQCVGVLLSTIHIRRKVNMAIPITSFLIAYSIGLVGLLLSQSIGIVSGIMLFYKTSVLAIVMFYMVLTLIETGWDYHLLFRPRCYRQIVHFFKNESLLRGFFCITFISVIILISLMTKKSTDRFLIFIPTTFCCISTLLVFKGLKLRWLIVPVGIILFVSVVALYENISRCFDLKVPVLFMDFSKVCAVFVFYLLSISFVGSRINESMKRWGYVIINSFLGVLFMIYDLGFNPCLFIGNEVCRNLETWKYETVIVREGMPSSDDVKSGCYVCDAWNGEKIYSCTFDSISQDWGLFIKISDVRMEECNRNKLLFEVKSGFLEIPLGLIFSVEALRRHCKAKEDTWGEYASKGYEEMMQAFIYKVKLNKKLDLDDIPNLRKLFDLQKERLNSISLLDESVNQDSLLFLLYRLESEHLSTALAINGFEEDMDIEKFDLLLKNQVTPLFLGYMDYLKNINVNTDSGDLRSLSSSIMNNNFSPLFEIWLSSCANAIKYRALSIRNKLEDVANYNEKTRGSGVSDKETDDSKRNLDECYKEGEFLRDFLHEQWTFIYRLAQKSTYSYSKFRCLLEGIYQIQNYNLPKDSKELKDIEWDLNKLDSTWLKIVDVYKLEKLKSSLEMFKEVECKIMKEYESAKRF